MDSFFLSFWSSQGLSGREPSGRARLPIASSELSKKVTTILVTVFSIFQRRLVTAFCRDLCHHLFRPGHLHLSSAFPSVALSVFPVSACPPARNRRFVRGR